MNGTRNLKSSYVYELKKVSNNQFWAKYKVLKIIKQNCLVIKAFKVKNLIFFCI